MDRPEAEGGDPGRNGGGRGAMGSQPDLGFARREALIADELGVGRALLKLADTYFLQGLTSRAIESLEAALKKIKRTSEPRLYLFGRHNLALYLTEAGRPLEAADIVAADMSLYREFPDAQTQLHLSWLHGKIGLGLEDYASAEEAFLSAQRGFMSEGFGYDAALVSLDLALLYLRQRRTQELRELVETAVPIFASQDIHREAAAALVLFQDAVRHDAITATLVEEVVRYLKVARNDPSLRFREPS
jgi:tetratricopeptide (TPR) repeat protein